MNTPAFSRITLAVAAALVLHVAVIASSHPRSGAAAPSVGGPLQVRFLAPPDPVVHEQTAQDRQDVGMSVQEQAADVASRDSAERLSEAQRSDRASIGRVEPAASATALSNSPSKLIAAGPAPARAEPAPARAEPASALPGAPDYLWGPSLDPGPQPLGEINPQYPDSANLQEGIVVIRVLIDDNGHVDNVGVVRAEPKGYFEEAAIEAFAKAPFAPGRVAGVPVKSQITVEVHFLPINRGSRISGRSY